MRNINLRSILALIVCALFSQGVDAWKIENGVLYYYGSGVDGITQDQTLNNLSDIKGDQTDGSAVTKVKFVGTFSSSIEGWFTNGGANEKSGITEIDLSDAHFTEQKVTPNDGWTEYSGPFFKFKNFSGLSTIQWPSDSSLKILGQGAFQSCGITSITFPESLKRICSSAFSECTQLQTIVFPEGIDGLDIEVQSFNNLKAIRDIYILGTGTITAANNAFDFEVTNGQSKPDAVTAALHFPESMTEQYVNLDDPLDPETALHPGLFQAWLVSHLAKAREPHANGWYEFINAGSLPTKDDEQVTTGEVILETYSNLKYDHLVPKGLKAYIVNGISKTKKGTDESGQPVYEYHLQLVSIPVIPANTGVILYGQSNARNLDGSHTYTMTTVNFTGDALRRDNWSQLDAEHVGLVRNFLEPTCYDPEKQEPMVVGPYDLDDKGQIKYRNFSLSKFSSTKTGKANGVVAGSSDDFRGFFRLKKGTTMPNNKAYLRLSPDATEYDSPFGGEAIVDMDVNYFKVYENKTDNPQLVDEYEAGKNDYWTKAIWKNPIWDSNKKDTHNWGERPSTTPMSKFEGEPIFIEEVDGTATLILPAQDVTPQNDVYYTLQGTKMVNPQAHGVYIKNGKKVLR